MITDFIKNLEENLMQANDVDLIKIWKDPLSPIHLKNAVLQEMLFRKKIHFKLEHLTDQEKTCLKAGLEELVTGGVYLTQKYASALAKNTTKAILKGREFAGLEDFSILVSQNKAYGHVRFRRPEIVSKEQALARQSEHGVSELEIKKWWKDKDALYLYSVREFVPYDNVRTIEPVNGAQVFAKSLTFIKDDPLEVKFIKSDAEKRFILGVVLVPEEIDLQEDVVAEDEIEKAAWRYMQEAQRIGIEHGKIDKSISVVESFIARSEMNLNEISVAKGSWLLGIKVHDDEMWKDIKQGKFEGFSIGGVARRSPEGVINEQT